MFTIFETKSSGRRLPHYSTSETEARSLAEWLRERGAQVRLTAIHVPEPVEPKALVDALNGKGEVCKREVLTEYGF